MEDMFERKVTTKYQVRYVNRRGDNVLWATLRSFEIAESEVIAAFKYLKGKIVTFEIVKVTYEPVKAIHLNK